MSRSLLSQRLVFCLALSAFGVGVSGRAVGMMKEDEDEVLFSSVRALVQRFVEKTEATPLQDNSKDQVTLQGRFMSPYILTQDQARQILGLDDYGRPLPNAKDLPLHRDFKVQVETDEEPFPISQSISHYLFHKLLTGEEGVLPTTILTLKDVQILTPSFSGKGKSQYNFTPIPYTYAIMLQPRSHTTLKEKLSSGTFQGQEFLPAQKGALLLSSFLTHPSEMLAEDISILRDEHNVPTLYYKPNVLSPSSICFSRASLKHFLDVKNTLYLLPEIMEQNIDLSLKQRLLNLSPSLFVLKWLDYLQKEEKEYDSLLAKSGLSLNHRIDLGLPLTLSPRLSEGLLKALSFLQEGLKTAFSYQGLLETLSPLVAYSYQTLKDLSPPAHWNALALIETQYDPIKGRTIPAKSLEEILNLSGTLVDGKDVFEALEEEKFPFAGNVLIQSLSEATHKVIEKLRFKDLSLEDQVFLLSLLGKSFKEPTLKVAQVQKQKELKDSQLADPYTLNSLLYHAKDKASVELLFGLGADPKVQNANKETPLHTRVKFLDPKDQKAAWPLLEALGQGGVDLSAEDNIGATVFDIALERGLDLVFARLIDLSARQWKPFTSLKVNPELLVKRYRQWVQEGRTDLELKEAFERLSQISSQSAWHLALEEILPAPQPLELTYEGLTDIAQKYIGNIIHRSMVENLITTKAPLEAIKQTIELLLQRPLTDLQNTGKTIQGVFMGERNLLPKIEQQLFEADGNVKKHNITYGRRDVARVEFQGKVLYFKHLPELPGFEYAIHLLHHKLIGQGTPPSELIKIGKEAFLVSLEIEGDNLQDVLKNTPDLLQQLEPQSLSALILMTMLTNPEDAKPDNYILNPLPFKPNQYSLVSVDNDHALIPTLARESDDPQARTFLQVKSLLYCLDQMKKPISEEVRELFYKINPYEILKEWLEDLKDLDARYEGLFPNAEAAALTSQGCIVRIPFKPQMVTQLYDKMVRLQKIFAPKKNSTSLQPLTHEEVLLKLEPLLGKRYGIGFTKPLSVAERFDLINERFYNKASMHYVSMTSSSILLQSLGIPAEESLIQAISLVKHLTIGGALEELEAIRVEKDKELLGGNKAEGFLKSLKTENARASFLSRFDFKNLDQAQQQALLRVLENSDPRSLTFRNCGALTQKILVENIGVGNLTKLVIVNNDNLNDDFLKALEERNGGLKGLFLEQLCGLTHVKLNFPKLTTLVLKNCENLKTIEIEGPHLQKFTASGCPLLEEVKLTGTNLRYLDLSNNDTLNDETLDVLLNNQPQLKILNVKNSQNISFPEVRSANHKYPVKLLKGIEAEKANLISSYVTRLLAQDKTFTKLDLGNKKIGEKKVKALSEALKVNTTLQCLNLSSNSVGPEGARALSEAIKVNGALEELNLSDNNIGNEGAKALGEALKVNITLKKLNLKSNKIGNKEESALAKALNMPQWMFQDFNTQWLRRAAEQILEEKLKDNLNLKYNVYVGKEFEEALDQALEGERVIAEALDIPLTQWVSQDFKTQWLEAAEQILEEKLKDDIVFQQLNLRTLSEGIKVNGALEELNLSDNKIRDEGIATIGVALKDNKTLKKLDLSSNAIGDKGGKALAEALKVNTTLQWLNLKYNDYVGKEFGEALGEALKINNTLQWLSLGNTFIEDEGAKFLAEALKINTTLQYLNLWNLTYNEETLKALGKALQVNQTLQKLAVWTGLYTDTAKNTVETFFKALEGNTALKKLKLNGYRACTIMTPLSNFLKINNTLQELILWEFLPENDVEEQDFYDALKVNTTLRRLIIKPVCKKWNFNEVLKVNANLKELILGHSSNNLFHSNVRPSIIRLLAQDQALTDLDLRNKKIGDKEIKTLSEALKVNMILQHLSLSGNNVGAEGAVALGEMLIKTKTLQYLNLQGNQIGDEGAKALGEALKVNTTLQYLYLGSNNIGIEGAKILSEALKINVTLQLLCLANNRIGAEGATAFGEALKANNALQQLSLEWALIKDEGASALSEALKINTTLQHLNLGLNNIRVNGARSLGEALIVNKTLQCLNLSSNGVGAEGLKVLNEALIINTTLKKLDLKCNNVGNGGVETFGEVLKINTILQHLDLEQNHIGVEGVKVLGKSLTTNTSLQHLNLQNNQIGDEGVKALSEALMINNTLQYLYLGSNNMGVEGVRALGEALKSNIALQHLGLEHNSMMAKEVKALSKVLKINKSLQRLDLGGNHIGAKGAKILSEALKVNSILQQLNLQWSYIENEGTEALGEVLKENKTLQYLSLQGNQIKYEGAKALAEALKINTTLKILELENNEIGDEGVNALSEALKVNTTLQQLPLYDAFTGVKESHTIHDFLFRNNQLASGASLTKEAPPTLPIFRGISEGISFTFLPLSLISSDLMEVIGLDRGLCVQQLLGMKSQAAFRELLAVDIKEAFLKSLLPVSMQNMTFQSLNEEITIGKKPGFEERLKAYTEDPYTYHSYVRFVLGKETPLHHSLQGGSLKAIAKFQELSYVIWQKDSENSSKLKKIDQVLTSPPVRHVLYTPAVGDPSGHYELLKEETSSGVFSFPEVGFSFEEESEGITFPWLKPADQNVPMGSPLFKMSTLDSFSAPLRNLLTPLQTSTLEFVCPPQKLTQQDIGNLAKLLENNTTLRKIVLPKCGMGDEEATLWASILKNNNSLTFLSLPNNQISATGLEDLRKALQTNKTLVQLRLAGNPGFNSQKEKEIQDLLSRNQGLQWADYIMKEKLTDVYISQIGAPGIRGLLKDMRDASFLKSVNLYSIPLYESKTLEIIKQFLSLAPQLQALTLLDCQLSGTAIDSLSSSLANHPQLTFLDLRGNRLQEGGIGALTHIVTSNPVLRHLDLRWNFIEEGALAPLIDAWKNTSTLQTLEVDLAPNSLLEEQVGRLREERKGAQGSPLLTPATMQVISKGIEVSLREATTLLKVENVAEDGNCGYSALGITRDEAAQKLLSHLHDSNIRQIIGTEIKENFDLLPPPLRTKTYQDLQKRQSEIDKEKQEKVSKLNDMLKRPANDRWPQDRLLREYFTPQQPLSESAIQLMRSLIELTLKEERFIQDKRDFCRQEDTVKLYIENYIRPLATVYFDQYEELNWLSYPPGFKYGYYGFSSADALARVLGKNLAIWTDEGLTHEYYWNPDAETAHLLHIATGGSSIRNHFNRLKPQ